MSILSKNGVFQVTFGGGEPMLRKDLFELAQYARDSSLTLGMTTNGSLLKDDERLSLFNQINVSYHQHREDSTEVLQEGIEKARRYTECGINFLCRQDNMKNLDTIVDLAKVHDAELLLLSYKPVNGDIEQFVPRHEIMEIAQGLHESGVRMAIDGFAASQCEGGYSFVDVSSTGDIFACSFHREPVGNILKEDFQRLWKRVPTLSICPYEP